MRTSAIFLLIVLAVIWVHLSYGISHGQGSPPAATPSSASTPSPAATPSPASTPAKPNASPSPAKPEPPCEPAKDLPPPESSQPLVNLLKQADISYTITKGGHFKIPFTINEETTLVTAHVAKLGDYQLVYLYCVVRNLPDGRSASPELLRKIAELNDRMLVGKLSINGSNVMYNSSFWLASATVDVLVSELMVAHFYRTTCAKEMEPFIME